MLLFVVVVVVIVVVVVDIILPRKTMEIAYMQRLWPEFSASRPFGFDVISHVIL